MFSPFSLIDLSLACYNKLSTTYESMLHYAKPYDEFRQLDTCINYLPTYGGEELHWGVPRSL